MAKAKYYLIYSLNTHFWNDYYMSGTTLSIEISKTMYYTQRLHSILEGYNIT